MSSDRVSAASFRKSDQGSLRTCPQRTGCDSSMSAVVEAVRRFTSLIDSTSALLASTSCRTTSSGQPRMHTGSTVRLSSSSATQLPFRTDSFTACTAIDALVYLPDRHRVFAAIADVLEPQGVFGLSDLVMQSNVSETERRAVDSYADAWDMPSLGTVQQCKAALGDVGFDLKAVEDITGHSVGRFRKWTTLSVQLLRNPIRSIVERLLHAYDLDPAAITEQVRDAYHALPFLKHIILVAEMKGS